MHDTCTCIFSRALIITCHFIKSLWFHQHCILYWIHAIFNVQLYIVHIFSSQKQFTDIFFSVFSDMFASVRCAALQQLKSKSDKDTILKTTYWICSSNNLIRANLWLELLSSHGEKHKAEDVNIFTQHSVGRYLINCWCSLTCSQRRSYLLHDST